jgi:hypothetical protein
MERVASEQLHDRSEDIQLPLSLIIDDELPPELTESVHQLRRDLSTSDMSMILLDLAQLSRRLMMGTPPNGASATVVGEAAIMPILIHDEDGNVTEQCEGPDSSGECQKAIPGRPLVCTGKWITASGWRFKIAPDTESCPVAALGLDRPPGLAESATAGNGL